MSAGIARKRRDLGAICAGCDLHLCLTRTHRRAWNKRGRARAARTPSSRLRRQQATGSRGASTCSCASRFTGHATTRRCCRRHRGVEASVAGGLGAKTRVVLGAVAFESEVTGPRVDAGGVGSHGAGISRRIVNANVERTIGNGWSVDAALSYSGAKRVTQPHRAECSRRLPLALCGRC